MLISHPCPVYSSHRTFRLSGICQYNQPLYSPAGRMGRITFISCLAVGSLPLRSGGSMDCRRFCPHGISATACRRNTETRLPPNLATTCRQIAETCFPSNLATACCQIASSEQVFLKCCCFAFLHNTPLPHFHCSGWNPMRFAERRRISFNIRRYYKDG